MKKAYESIEMEVIRFSAEDIVVTSGGIELPDDPIED